jgi:hypothetical protein
MVSEMVAFNFVTEGVTTDRRTIAKAGGAVALGALAPAVTQTGATPALTAGNHNLSSGCRVSPPNRAEDEAVSKPDVRNVIAGKRKHPEAFRELNFAPFPRVEWPRRGEKPQPGHLRTLADGRYPDWHHLAHADLAAALVVQGIGLPHRRQYASGGPRTTSPPTPVS